MGYIWHGYGKTYILLYGLQCTGKESETYDTKFHRIISFSYRAFVRLESIIFLTYF